jgi:nucleoside 2-deoxyribosyltransferase
MRQEIKISKFIIADLTHNNAGAYWEAGFAEGIGKSVIYTCEKSVFENADTKPHFDVNHHLTIIWDKEDPEEAVEELKAAIRYTFPESKQQDD